MAHCQHSCNLSTGSDAEMQQNTKQFPSRGSANYTNIGDAISKIFRIAVFCLKMPVSIQFQNYTYGTGQ